MKMHLRVLVIISLILNIQYCYCTSINQKCVIVGNIDNGIYNVDIEWKSIDVISCNIKSIRYFNSCEFQKRYYINLRNNSLKPVNVYFENNEFDKRYSNIQFNQTVNFVFCKNDNKIILKDNNSDKITINII